MTLMKFNTKIHVAESSAVSVGLGLEGIVW